MPSEDFALSVWQPWASLIVYGRLSQWQQRLFKDCENRSRPLPRSMHGRRVVIQAAAVRSPDAFSKANALLRRFSIHEIGMHECLFGYALGTALIHPDEPRVSIWKEPGSFAWRLSSPWPFEPPFRLTGEQGFFRVDRSRLSARGNRSMQWLDLRRGTD